MGRRAEILRTQKLRLALKLCHRGDLEAEKDVRMVPGTGTDWGKGVRLGIGGGWNHYKWTKQGELCQDNKQRVTFSKL